MTSAMPVAGPPTRVMRSSFAVARLPTSLAQILLVCSTWAALFFLLWPVHSSSNVGNASSLLLHRGEASGIGVVNSTLKGPGLFTQLDGLEGASISDAVHLASHCLQQQKRATEQRRRQQQLRDQHLFPGLPQDFDAQIYLAYHPDLRALSVTTEDTAKQHYLDKGRKEGRLYKRIRVLLRYTACSGLINQHYSHIAAFALAAMLGADIVLPPAVCRDSFARYFSTIKEKNEVQWSPVEVDSILDVDYIINYWRPRGIVVHHTPALQPFPDMTQPNVAFPKYQQARIDPGLVARLEGVYLQDLTMEELVEKSRAAIVDLATSILKKDPNTNLTSLVLDLPCSFFMLRTLSSLRLVTEVARSLHFARPLVELADIVVDGMTLGGKAVWDSYIRKMVRVGFDNATRLYVASGLLTYGASAEMNHTIMHLKRMGVCNEVHHKERYIPQSEMEKLHSEQKALVDFIVLARAQRFVGFGPSTFSFYLREYRALKGLSRKLADLLDAGSLIASDPLFHSAGTIV